MLYFEKNTPAEQSTYYEFR